MTDVIIIGGGLAGTVVASRLHQRAPHRSIVLIEAGPDPANHPHVLNPAEAALLHFSDLDYKDFTTPQVYLDGKPRYNCAIKSLGGGTVINTGGWIRGDAQDYDEWARNVNDQRWSYNGLLPYFKRCERHFDPDADPSQHGFEGPVHTASVSSSGRKYPLRETVLRLWSHLGLRQIDDLNEGHPQGIAELVESWRDGKRQIVQSVYPLNGVRVLSETLVRRVILESNIAVGVELANHEVIRLRDGGQVIVSAGAYRTPQVLMLSGIGDEAQLSKHGIPVNINLPQVGLNLHDHLGLFRYWKLRHPENGLSLGSPNFGGPNYEKGGPVDFLVRAPISTAPLKLAIHKDEGPTTDDHPLLQGRTHLEMLMLYATYGAEAQGLQIPMDGSSVMTFIMGCLPTSRGSVTLNSNNPADAPVIDPNYFATEADRHVLREGFKMHTRLMFGTPEGKELIESEHTPPGLPVLGTDATDENIEHRIKLGGSTVFHPAGTAAMGKVVDTSLQVYGVKNLRVVDASVIPQPLAAHYQVVVFAIAEQAVDIVLSESFEIFH